MFSCVVDESDSDDDFGHTSRNIAATNIGYILPAPELIDDHASSVHSIAISHFGDIITGGCGEIYINRYGEFEETSNIKGILCGFEAVYSLVVLYGVEPKFISAHGDGLLRAWNLLSRTPLQSVRGHDGSAIGLVALQGAEPVIISCGVDCLVKFWDPELNNLTQLPPESDSVLSIAASWQGESSVVISGMSDGNIGMWMYSPPETFMNIRHLNVSQNSVRALATTSSIFAVGRYDGTIEVRSIRTGDLKFALEGHLDVVRSLDIYDGKFPMLASGSWDGTVCLWNLETGDRIQVLRGHTDDVTAVAVALGSRPFVVSGSKDWSVRVWDISNIVK